MPFHFLLVAILLTLLTAPASVAGQDASGAQNADTFYTAQKWAEAAVGGKTWNVNYDFIYVRQKEKAAN
jgi:hypothetical protein